jgi:hypothetical protein
VTVNFFLFILKHVLIFMLASYSLKINVKYIECKIDSNGTKNPTSHAYHRIKRDKNRDGV